MNGTRFWKDAGTIHYPPRIQQVRFSRWNVMRCDLWRLPSTKIGCSHCKRTRQCQSLVLLSKPSRETFSGRQCFCKYSLPLFLQELMDFSIVPCALCVDMNVTKDITLINNNNSSKSFYQFDRRKRFFVRWTLERSQSVFCKARSPKVIVFCIYCVSEFLSKVVRGFRTLLCIYSQSFLIQHFTYKKLDE